MPGISNMNGYGESSRFNDRPYGMNGGGYDPYSSEIPDYSRRPLGETFRGAEENFSSSRRPLRETYGGGEDFSSPRRPLGETNRGGAEYISSTRRPLGETYGRDDYMREPPYDGEEVRGSDLRLTLPNDMYRDDQHDYGRTNNGYARDDQGSLDGMRNLCFEVDHLATFTASKDKPTSGPLTFEDGLKKLKQMEVQTGIWTMRCEMIIEPSCIVILDKSTAEEYERFPLHHVHDPVGVLRDDRNEVHTNLVMFTVCEDPKRKYAISDMHIFQVVEKTAQPQDIVDEILAAKQGRRPMQSGPMVPPPPQGPAPNPPHIGMSQRPLGPNRASYIPNMDDNDMDAGLNERLEKNVQLLNFCFDDIEKFVSRLQAAAEAYKELERRRRERSAKKMKNNRHGEGLLSMKAKPPPSDDFIDIFQKFKYAFNLLADLKAHIHDPNAPELVHFLFTPLSLIYEASRDPVHHGRDLSDEARSPLLSASAKDLLLNCLTSKELELWQALGRFWTNSREEYKDYVEPYNPRFYNGISPAPVVMAMDRNKLEMAVANLDHQTQARARDFDRRQEEPMPYPRMDDRGFRSTVNDYDREENLYARSTKPTSAPPPGAIPNTNVSRYQQYVEKHIDRNKNVHKPLQESYRPEPPSYRPEPPRSREEANNAFLRTLSSKNPSMIYEVVHDRDGKNDKEITVKKGDIVEVLDSQRNWWKIVNCYGKEGYAPYTILHKQDKYKDDIYSTKIDTDRGRNSGEYNSYIPPSHNIPEPPPIDSARMSGIRRESPDSRSDGGGASYQDDRGSDRSFNHRHNDSYDEQFHGDRYNGDRYHGDKIDRYSDNSRRGNHRHRPDYNSDDSRNDSDRYSPGYGNSPRNGGYRNHHDRSDDRSQNSRDFNQNDDILRHGRQQSQRSNDRQVDRSDDRHVDRNVAPPPPPPTTRPPALKKTEPKRHERQEKAKTPKNDLHNELVKRVSAHNLALPKSTSTVYISKTSDPDEVQEWLASKGFSRSCRETLRGYSGEEVFMMKRKEMDRLLGKEEAHRLESLTTVQKKISNFETINPGKFELKNILEERKKRAEKDTSDTRHIPQPPSFAPESPDYSDSDSDASSDDFGNAGKTLRGLLQQQRKRIQKGTYQQH